MRDITIQNLEESQLKQHTQNNYDKIEPFADYDPDNYLQYDLPKEMSKPNKYVVYKDDKSIIESDNDCIWHCNEGKKLSNIIKNNFNSEYDKIIIQPINGFTYDIYHKGNNCP